MTNLKETIIQISLILLAAAVVILAIMPLENTNWADSIRNDAAVADDAIQSDQAQREGFNGEGAEPQIGGAIAYVASFIKIILFMGIPGLITLGVLRLTHRKQNQIVKGAT